MPQKKTLKEYHSVPRGWTAEEIFEKHKNLNGTFDLWTEKPKKFPAPAWMTNRQAWHHYQNTLQKVSDGIKQKDKACTEIAIQFIELHFIGSCSGYIRESLARRLKQANLSREQKERLNRHFINLLESRVRTREFKIYFSLWRNITPLEDRLELAHNLPCRTAKGTEWLTKNLVQQ